MKLPKVIAVSLFGLASATAMPLIPVIGDSGSSSNAYADDSVILIPGTGSDDDGSTGSGAEDTGNGGTGDEESADNGTGDEESSASSSDEEGGTGTGGGTSGGGGD
ncbi:hypothetical protein EHS39_03750 [Ensifer sp. MPMI2T]|nr:hypothetical protein EHS39_03750 [Ensifer sp. MPMI2T]